MMEGRKYYEKGLKILYELGNYAVSKYAIYISQYINLKNRKKVNALLVDLSTKAQIPISKEIFEDAIATMTFAIRLSGDVTALDHLLRVDDAVNMWGIT